ncbi:MAG TPA: cytochrome c oxidase assembly protein, partial [Acidimicrobiales bacterium]|nr:cytochrome c oxidase assembly protein [Acidimicrobiales bacterium]
MPGPFPVPAVDVPPDMWHNLGSTAISPVASLLILGSAALYLVGVWRFNRLFPETPWSARRTAALLGATALTFAAIELVIGVYDDVVFYDHMIQHLMLIMLAAPLYAMSAPLDLLQRSTTGRAHRLVTRLLGSAFAEVVGHPA